MIIRSVLLTLLSHLNRSAEATRSAASMMESRTYLCLDRIYFLVQRVYFFPDSTSQSFSIFMSDISASCSSATVYLQLQLSGFLIHTDKKNDPMLHYPLFTNTHEVCYDHV